MLQVEDILGFGQIQVKTITKSVKVFNAKKAVENVVKMQLFQAQSKDIEIITHFFGFGL